MSKDVLVEDLVRIEIGKNDFIVLERRDAKALCLALNEIFKDELGTTAPLRELFSYPVPIPLWEEYLHPWNTIITCGGCYDGE